MFRTPRQLIQQSTQQWFLTWNSTPGGNSISACELTCSLISSLARNVAQAANSMKEGRWDRKLYSGFELSGKTLGVLGFGRIGREVARRMQSFGMNIVAFDPMLSEEAAKELRVMKANLDEIWPIADYITVHTPLIPQTKSKSWKSIWLSRLFPYEKKVLASIGSSTFFANFQYFRAKKVLDPILTNTFFHTG